MIREMLKEYVVVRKNVKRNVILRKMPEKFCTSKNVRGMLVTEMLVR